MAKHCPYCGKSSDNVEFKGNYCIDCFKQRIWKLDLPSVVELEQCSTCSRVRYKGRMSGYTAGAVQDKIAKEMKSNYSAKIKNIELKGKDNKAVAILEGEGFEQEVELDIRFKKFQCIECSRHSSGYYEAIIQLRGNPKKVENFAVGLQNKILNNGSFVAKIEDLKEGIDLYVGSTMIARQVMDELNMEYSTSKKLAGRKDGKDLFRRSFCVRL